MANAFPNFLLIPVKLKNKAEHQLVFKMSQKLKQNTETMDILQDQGTCVTIQNIITIAFLEI